MESLGLILIFLLKGSLPWDIHPPQLEYVDPLKATGFLQIDENEKRLQVFRDHKLKIRIDSTIASLTEGLPDVFYRYLKHCRMLKFEEKPNYDYLKQLFKDYKEQ